MHQYSLTYKHLRQLLAVTVFLLLPPCLCGQSFVLTNYKAGEGLAHDNVRDIASDNSGFLWFGTWDGLSRYDGMEFSNYHHMPGDSTSLPYFSVNRVVIDGRNNLWLSTDDGRISIMNQAAGTFSVVSNLGRHSLAKLISFCADDEGNLLFVLKESILRYFPSTGNVQSFPFIGDIPDPEKFVFGQYYVLPDGPDHLWLTGPHVIEIRLKGNETDSLMRAEITGINRVERIRDFPSVLIENTGTCELIRDVEGNIMLASTTGLFVHDIKKQVFREYAGEAGDLELAGKEPVAFFTYGEGIHILLPERDTVIVIPQPAGEVPLKIFRQGSDLLWFSHQSSGGTPSGVTKTVITPNHFTLINPFPDPNSDLTVFCVTEDSKGGLWIAARDRNYLIRIAPDGQARKLNSMSPEEQKQFWHPRSFVPDTTGVWIGYFFRKLLYYRHDSGRFEEHSPEAGMVHTICSDGAGRLFIADQGIKRYDPVTHETTLLMALDDTITIFTLYLDESILWAGASHSCLIRYDILTGKHEIIRIIGEKSNIEDIIPGSDGDLWLAMLGGGVCRYNTLKGTRVFYTTAVGLSNNTTYSLLKDKSGNIWVSTNSGISVINPSTGLIRRFGQNDGLSIHEFNSDAVFESDDGRFYFGGVGGLVRFSPDQLLKAQDKDKQNGIIILDVDVSGIERVTDKPFHKADTIILKKGENNFHIRFIIPEFRYPEKIRYRYRLEGVSESWSVTDHRDRNINYGNLKPGWYKLVIEGTDPNGSWSNSREVNIFIRPYFYQTLLFRITLPLMILILLAVPALLLAKQFRQREKQKQDNLRHQALRGQMNPHFIFNSLNSINYFISNNDKLSANRYIADFSKLIRSVLNNMNEDYVILHRELESIEDYLKIEHLRFGDKFDYTLVIDENIDLNSLKVSPGLVQPFIENAIWHGVRGLESRKGRIEIRFRMVNGNLVCTVEDDGIGRSRADAMKEKSQRGRSRGIEMALERIKIINSLQAGNFEVRITDLYPGSDETGTKVEIDVPVQRS